MSEIIDHAPGTATAKLAPKAAPAKSFGLPAMILLLVAICLVGNGVLYFAGLWRPLWWLALLADFVLIVMAAEQVGRSVPPARRKLYERTLAFGFPLLALVAWRPTRSNVLLITTLWHAIDLVWLVMFPVLYLA